MSHTLVVYGHPHDKSSNHAIPETITASLGKAGKKYKVIDLHTDDFGPNYPTKELSLYKDGGIANPLITEYQKLVDGADSLIVLSPTRWSYLMPNVEGFFDKVMKKPWVYIDIRAGLKGKLQHISKSWVITTAIAPKQCPQLLAGNPIKGTFTSTVIKSLGLRNVRRTHFGQVSKQGGDHHEKFLREVRE